MSRLSEPSGDTVMQDFDTNHHCDDTRQARQGEVDQLLSAVYEAFPQMSADGRKQFAKGWTTSQACGRQR
jgi:hypothetical protein